MKRLLLVWTSISISILINAQVLTLEEAIATGLQNNYNILLAKNDSVSAAIDYSYRNAAFLPRLNAAIGAVWNKNNQLQEFNTGNNRKGDVKSGNLNAAVNLNWTLFDGFRMFAIKERVEELVVLGGLTIRNEINNNLATLITTYYNIVQGRQQLKATEEQMSISLERVKLADKKLSVGLGTKQELLQAQLDVNAQKAAQLRQQTAIEQLKQQLNNLMGIESKTSYDVLDTIPINFGITLEEVVLSAESLNPSLLIAKKNIDIANIFLKERRGELLPTVAFNSAYIFSRTNNDVALNPALPIFNRNQGFNYGFSAAIPIFNNFNTRRLIKQARLDIVSQELLLGRQRLEVDLRIYNAFKTYQFQKQALELEESNIELAKENVMISFERYRLGVATYIELREAQISLADAYNRLITARFDTKTAEIELLRLKGDLLR